ncbi:BlaI/MecI/CopY family transcriptional regulator [Ulvibacterium sp.]|uniref:BlaI/MecI/CopY family transcriptional regulator n=1 Tax=Ulvibacterium sp. TaxID=2665914 RepID=UPI003BAAFC32
MKQLAKREDQIMQIVWRLEKAFIRDIIKEIPDPKPHYNTVATMVKILVRKGFLKSELLGNSYRYSPAIEKDAYRDQHLVNIKKKYFGNSLPKMIAHFAKGEKLSDEEIREIIRIIESQKS